MTGETGLGKERQTYGRMPDLLPHDSDAFDNSGARVIDAIKHRLDVSSVSAIAAVTGYR